MPAGRSAIAQAPKRRNRLRHSAAQGFRSDARETVRFIIGPTLADPARLFGVRNHGPPIRPHHYRSRPHERPALHPRHAPHRQASGCGRREGLNGAEIAALIADVLVRLPEAIARGALITVTERNIRVFIDRVARS